MVSRWLHIYVSMVSFAIVLFFAVTGLTLNHADKFAYQQRTQQVKGKLNTQWVKTKAGYCRIPAQYKPCKKPGKRIQDR